MLAQRVFVMGTASIRTITITQACTHAHSISLEITTTYLPSTLLGRYGVLLGTRHWVMSRHRLGGIACTRGGPKYQMFEIEVLLSREIR